MNMSLTSWHAAESNYQCGCRPAHFERRLGCREACGPYPDKGTPAGIDSVRVGDTLMQVDGVVNVHDLLIWTITSGLNSLSCHLLAVISFFVHGYSSFFERRFLMRFRIMLAV